MTESVEEKAAKVVYHHVIDVEIQKEVEEEKESLSGIFDRNFDEGFEYCRKKGKNIRDAGYGTFETIVREISGNATKATNAGRRKERQEESAYWGRSLGYLIGAIKFLYSNEMDEQTAADVGSDLARACEDVAVLLKKNARHTSESPIRKRIKRIIRKRNRHLTSSQHKYLEEMAHSFH